MKTRMMKIKILFNIMRKQILLFFVLSIFFSNAQTKWTLEECVIYALENKIISNKLKMHY